MFKRQLFFILAITIIFNGCISDITVDFEKSPAEFVLNSILNPQNDTVFVSLSYTKSIDSEQSFEAVDNAKIELFAGEKSVGKFLYADSSRYYLPINVKPGKTYRIEAETAKNKVWAETTVPENMEATIQIDNPEDYLKNYLVQLKDNQQKENFYWISVTGFEGSMKNRSKNIACALRSNFEYADDFNQSIYNDGRFRFEYKFYLRFTDLQLSEKVTEVVFRPLCIDRPEEVFVLSVDYHLDKYMKSSLLLQEMDLYAEDMPVIYSPQPVYSNIHGGTGIFGSFNSVSKEFARE